jgi:hypothetical protein
MGRKCSTRFFGKERDTRKKGQNKNRKKKNGGEARN